MTTKQLGEIVAREISEGRGDHVVCVELGAPNAEIFLADRATRSYFCDRDMFSLCADDRKDP